MNPYRSTKPGRRYPTAIIAEPMFPREDHVPFDPRLFWLVIGAALLLDAIIIKAAVWVLG